MIYVINAAKRDVVNIEWWLSNRRSGAITHLVFQLVDDTLLHGNKVMKDLISFQCVYI